MVGNWQGFSWGDLFRSLCVRTLNMLSPKRSRPFPLKYFYQCTPMSSYWHEQFPGDGNATCLNYESGQTKWDSPTAFSIPLTLIHKIKAATLCWDCSYGEVTLQTELLPCRSGFRLQSSSAGGMWAHTCYEKFGVLEDGVKKAEDIDFHIPTISPNKVYALSTNIATVIERQWRTTQGSEVQIVTQTPEPVRTGTKFMLIIFQLKKGRTRIWKGIHCDFEG